MACFRVGVNRSELHIFLALCELPLYGFALAHQISDSIPDLNLHQISHFLCPAFDQRIQVIGLFLKILLGLRNLGLSNRKLYVEAFSVLFQG